VATKKQWGDDRDDSEDSTREPLTGDGEVNRRPRGDMESEWSAILS
jgi:hypothetical protein